MSLSKKLFSILFFLFLAFGQSNLFSWPTFNFAQKWQSLKGSISQDKKNHLQKYWAPYAVAGATALAGSCLFGPQKFTSGIALLAASPFYGLYKLSNWVGQDDLGNEHFFSGLGKVIRYAIPTSFVGLAYKWGSHWRQFDAIDYGLDNGQNITDVNQSGFLFSAWKISDWSNLTVINTSKEDVKSALKSFKLDESGNTKLMAKIYTEKEQLKKWICQVGVYTDLPGNLAQEVIKDKSIQESMLPNTSDAENAIKVADTIFEKDLVTKLFDETKEDNKLLKDCKPHFGSSICYVSQWEFCYPTRIALLAWPEKASKLCLKLLRYYVRLCAI